MNVYNKIINEINICFSEKSTIDPTPVIISIIKRNLINIDKSRLKFIKPKWLIYGFENNKINVLKFSKIAEEYSIFVKQLNDEFSKILNVSLEEKIKKLDNFKF